jgi:hypothetical protein
MSGADILALQRTIGNNAVAQLVGRPRRKADPHRNPVSMLRSMTASELCDLYLSTEDLEFVSQRDVFTRAWLQGAGGPVILREIERRLDRLVEAGGKDELNRLVRTLEAAQGEATRRTQVLTMVRTRIPKVLRPGDRFLSAHERSELVRVTGDDIGLAFAAFLAACGDHKDALKAAAKADAEVIALVIDVLTGFLAPAVGRSLGRVAGRLPLSTAPSLTYLRVLNVLENSDVTKAVFTGVMKAAGTTLKVKSMALIGEGEADLFLTRLADWRQQEAHNLDARLQHLSDEELVVIAAAHLPEVSDSSAYRKSIGELLAAFRSEVEPIGSTIVMGESATTWLVAWVRGRINRRLALLSYISAPGMDDYRFARWVSPEMQDLAKAKAGVVEEIPADEVIGLPLLWDIGTTPRP